MAASPSRRRDAGGRLARAEPERAARPRRRQRHAIGPDGGLYVVSAFGSEVARVDTGSGAMEIVSPLGDAIVSPDDIAFGPDGDFYVTECMDARVTGFKDGRTWVVADDLTGVNGIDVFDGPRCRRPVPARGEALVDGARRLGPHAARRRPRGPNGLSCSPDGNVYFVQVFTGEVMRVP